MQNSVFFLKPLISNVFRNTCLISKLANCIHKISIRPKFTSPQLFFHFRMILEYFSSYYTFYHPDKFAGTLFWNRLNQKMNMILVCPNLKKVNLIAFFNLKTNFFHRYINRFTEDNPSILCRTNKMIQEYRNIVRFMYVLATAHTHKDINYAASSGELTPKGD